MLDSTATIRAPEPDAWESYGHHTPSRDQFAAEALTRLSGLAFPYLKAAAAVTMALALLGVIANVGVDRAPSPLAFEMLQRFQHDVERSIPTAWNFTLIVINFSVCLVAAMIIRAEGGRTAWCWGYAAFLFLFLAYDEAAQFHEGFSSIEIPGLDKIIVGFSTWILIVVPATFMAITPLVVLFHTFTSRTKVLLLFSGLVFLMGAVGLEITSAHYEQAHGRDIGYFQITIIEETLEMLGMVIFTFAILNSLGDAAVSFGGGPAE